MKVREGLERFLETTRNSNRKMAESSMGMLEDSRAKIEHLRMEVTNLSALRPFI